MTSHEQLRQDSECSFDCWSQQVEGRMALADVSDQKTDVQLPGAVEGLVDFVLSEHPGDEAMELRVFFHNVLAEIMQDEDLPLEEAAQREVDILSRVEGKIAARDGSFAPVQMTSRLDY